MGRVNTMHITCRRDEYPVFFEGFSCIMWINHVRKVDRMKVYVELNGMPREIAGTDLIEVDVPANVTYEGVVARLALLKPELVGILIDQDGKTFLSSNMFIRNGDMAQPAMLMDEQPADGDRLTIISPITGG